MGPTFFTRYHPLVMTLMIYAMADVAFSCVIGMSACYTNKIWSNPYYPLLHATLTCFSIMSVYLIASSSVKLALALHGTLKLILLLWTIHCIYDPHLYLIRKSEAIAVGLYYLLTIVFEMTAFFVINKMNIPYFPDELPVEKIRDLEDDDDDDEIIVTCC